MMTAAQKDEAGYDLLPVKITIDNPGVENNFFAVKISKGVVSEEFSTSKEGELPLLYLPLNRSLTVKLDGESNDLDMTTHFYFLENKDFTGIKQVNGDYYFYVQEGSDQAELTFTVENSTWSCNFTAK